MEMSTEHYIIAHQRMFVFQYDVQTDIVNSIVNGHITEKGKNGKISNTTRTQGFYILLEQRKNGKISNTAMNTGFYILLEQRKNGKISNTAMNTEVLDITGATEKRQKQ